MQPRFLDWDGGALQQQTGTIPGEIGLGLLVVFVCFLSALSLNS